MNRIVILDEATSSLTHSMETRLSGALADHFRAATVITITHRVRMRNSINSTPSLIHRGRWGNFDIAHTDKHEEKWTQYNPEF